ncbi:MAG TPA: hypothetical protein VIC85_15010 [Ktedonobacterales bacterium]
MRSRRSRVLRVAVAGVILVAGALGYVLVGLRLFGQYQLAYANYQVDVAGKCDTLITWTPPSEIYTAFYENEPSLLTVRYRSPNPQPLRLTLSIPGFTQAQSFDVQGSAAFRTQSFKPPLLGASALDALVGPQARDAQIELSVRGANQQVCDTPWPVRLESRQLMRWQGTGGKDLSPYLAGWVTPQSAAVQTLVGRAADWLAAHPQDYPAANALFGYNGGAASPDAVRQQVDAIYDTLAFTYRVHYVNPNIAYPDGETQLIRLPQDILSSPAPTGMCIETTIIMASALEAIGLRPYIIIVPHHAFLGVSLGQAPTAPREYWETTDLNSGVSGDAANVHGDGEFQQWKRQNQVLRTIDIMVERQHGIGPME